MQPEPQNDMENDGIDWMPPAGPYDRGPLPQADLWFAPEHLTDPPAVIPGPRADRGGLVNPRDWAIAEAGLARDLAEVALLFGALDERLRPAPGGWRRRLALTEAAALSWWAGDRVSVERLALWSSLRLTGPQDEAQALARADWALRRLEGSAPPDIGSDTGLSAFLGRHVPASGTGLDGLSDLAAMAQGLRHLHPITRAAALFHGWRILAGHGDAVRDIEAAVLSARIAAEMTLSPGQGGAVFLPLGLTGRATGPVADRLAHWLRGAAQGTRAALRHLDQIAGWTAGARAAIAPLQGRTPGLLVSVLAEWPMVTAPMTEDITKASRASVQRNLALLQALGLIREVTGQGRYRVWTVRL